MLKCLALGSCIGAVVTLIQIIVQGATWYDQLCSTKVEFHPRVHLTSTQEQFRKLYKGRQAAGVPAARHGIDTS